MVCRLYKNNCRFGINQNSMSSKTKQLLQQYLKKLNNLEKAIQRKDETDSELLTFWKGVVRDSNGRWLEYYFEGYKYFQYGIQKIPDLHNSSNVSYLTTVINQQRDFIKGLINGNITDFMLWIISLHKKQIYTGHAIKVSSRQRFALIMHSRVVLGTVIPLAKKYQDPYRNTKTQVVYFPEIDKEGLPIDVWVNEKDVFHYYPKPKYYPQYLSVMEKTLQDILTISSKEELLVKIATYYQYAISTHMFENVNQSLFANQVNALLQVFGYKPINHGALDFVAMRFQPQNFVRYFIDEVKAGQRKYPLDIDKRYLRLSKLK